MTTVRSPKARGKGERERPAAEKSEARLRELDRERRALVAGRNVWWPASLPPGPRRKTVHVRALLDDARIVITLHAAGAELEELVAKLLQRLIQTKLVHAPDDFDDAIDYVLVKCAERNKFDAEDLARWALMACGVTANVAGKRIEAAVVKQLP